jgi:acyl-CoA-binding protein
MSKSTAPLPDWEAVLSAAARLQSLLPQAVLVGGTASALHAGHRLSRDADHVLVDLRANFDDILAQLESVAGWKTARVRRPVLILGRLDGIETGVRQLIRSEPLETTTISSQGRSITLPTKAEILRIKAALILRRNAARDYLDFVALADQMGDQGAATALTAFDKYYPQDNGQSALQQLLAQLANALPFDLDEMEPGLHEYKNLDPKWHAWANVKGAAARLSVDLLDRLPP